MTEPDESQIVRRVTTEGMDRPTVLLIWAVAAAILMLAALLAYGWVSGALSGGTQPRTAQEDALAVTAAAIAKNPKDGSQYAIRAETLFKLGRKTEAFQVLDQGQQAVGKQNPDLLYILRTKTSLLNAEGKFSDAVLAGIEAMKASDDYLARQGAALAQQHVTDINGNLHVQVSVDTAVQLASAYMGTKQYDKAIELYTYAVKLDPFAGDVIMQRGYAYLAAGDKAKAKADFEQTLKYLPGDPQATSGLKQASN